MTTTKKIAIPEPPQELDVRPTCRRCRRKVARGGTDSHGVCRPCGAAGADRAREHFNNVGKG